MAAEDPSSPMERLIRASVSLSLMSPEERATRDANFREQERVWKEYPELRPDMPDEIQRYNFWISRTDNLKGENIEEIRAKMITARTIAVSNFLKEELSKREARSPLGQEKERLKEKLSAAEHNLFLSKILGVGSVLLTIISLSRAAQEIALLLYNGIVFLFGFSLIIIFCLSVLIYLYLNFCASRQKKMMKTQGTKLFDKNSTIRWCKNCTNYKNIKEYENLHSGLWRADFHPDVDRLPCSIVQKTTATWADYFESDPHKRSLFPKNCPDFVDRM